jgi:signal transduction histidine kinase
MNTPPQTLTDLSKTFSEASHALRTPLSVLMLELGMIEDKRARKLEDDVAAMGEAVRKSFLLLKLYAGDVGTRTQIDLTDLVRQIALDHQAAAQSKNIDLVFGQVSVCDASVYVDAVQESINCLIENAIAHSPAGSRVEVGVGPGKTVTVEDSGPGFADDTNICRLEAFAKPAPDGIGVGVGLPIAAATARLHGGALKLSRSDMGGARVTLEFEPEPQGPTK